MSVVSPRFRMGGDYAKEFDDLRAKGWKLQVIPLTHIIWKYIPLLGFSQPLPSERRDQQNGLYAPSQVESSGSSDSDFLNVASSASSARVKFIGTEVILLI